MRLTSSATILDFDPYTSRTQDNATHNLGDLACLTDGRWFRHGSSGGSNVSRGKLQLAPAPKANHANIAVAVDPTVDDTQLTVTLGATAAVAGEYNEGFVAVNDVDGEGQDFQIRSHPAANASASLLIKLFDPIVVDLTTSSQVTLVHNAWNGVVEGTAATRRGGGVPLVAVNAGDYGWFQTKGVKSTLIGVAATLGAFLTADGSTAGAVTDQTDVTAPIAQVWVGRADIVAGVATEYNPISLCID